MRKAGWLAAVVLGMAVMARAESYNIVQLTDMDREVTVQAVSATELKDLKKQIETETKLFQKAKEMAAKEWATRIAAERKLNDKNAPRTLPFPSAQLRERKMSVMPRSFMNKEEADKAVQVIEERAARQADFKQQQEIKSGNQGGKSGNRDKELNLREAATFLKSKIEELTASTAGGAAAPAGAADAAGAAAPAGGAAAPAGAVPPAGAAAPAGAAVAK